MDSYHFGIGIPGFRMRNLNRITSFLRDIFSDAVSAGNVNNTITIDNQTRTVTDTNSRISIATGSVYFNTGTTANDGLWYPTVNRVSGRLLRAEINLANTSGTVSIGFDGNQAGSILDSIQFASGGILNVIPNGGSPLQVGTYTATAYTIVIALRSVGAYWFIKGGT